MWIALMLIVAAFSATFAYKISRDKQKPKIEQFQKEFYERASECKKLQIAVTQKKANEAIEN